MRIASRVFWLPKDPGYAEEYEDAHALDIDRGVAAIADGVSSAIFSRQWARILTAAAIVERPDVASESFWAWLSERRREWHEAIDFPGLTFFQRGKLQQCGGAFATLLCLDWQPINEGIAWSALAIGDGGLLHVRDRELLQAFPIAMSEELAGDPLTIPSVNRQTDHALEFRSASSVALPGDWLVLTTDALLGWALREMENGRPPDWESFWDASDESFAQRIQSLRNDRAIRVDDTTLVLLRVIENEDHADMVSDIIEEPETEPTDEPAN